MALARLRVLSLPSQLFARVRLLIAAVSIACIALSGPGSAVSARTFWPEDQQRLRVGLRIFPAVLGALEGLSQRRSADGSLHVVVAYHGSDEAVQQVVAALQEIDQVQEMPLEVKVLALDDLQAYRAPPPLGGVFIASVGIEPERLQRLSTTHGVLVFSPFAGDVQAGAVAGIRVSDRILPAVNLAQAQRAGVRFQAFFLRVAHHAE